MNKELLEKLNISRITAVISPHIDENEFNFNLEKQGLVIFPNSAHINFVSSYIVGNKEIFKVGLDENDPELLNQPYEQRMESIRKMRLVAREIERYHYNNIDIEDPDFWFKVKHAKPDNQQLWGTLSITLKNESIALDLLSFEGFLKYWVISNGGFAEIAPSYEYLINSDKKYRYYLKDVERQTMLTAKNVVTFNRAISKLDSLYSSSSNHKKLFLLAKYLTSEGYSFNSTNYNPDYCMISLDKFIKGKDPNAKNKDQVVTEFMELVDKSNDYLYTLNVVKGLMQIGRIKYVDKTGSFFCLDNNLNVGRNIKEITEYFMIAENFDYLNTLCSMYGNQFGMVPEYMKNINRHELTKEEIKTEPLLENVSKETNQDKPSTKEAKTRSKKRAPVKRSKVKATNPDSLIS